MVLGNVEFWAGLICFPKLDKWQ